MAACEFCVPYQDIQFQLAHARGYLVPVQGGQFQSGVPLRTAHVLSSDTEVIKDPCPSGDVCQETQLKRSVLTHLLIEQLHYFCSIISSVIITFEPHK